MTPSQPSHCNLCERGVLGHNGVTSCGSYLEDSLATESCSTCLSINLRVSKEGLNDLKATIVSSPDEGSSLVLITCIDLDSRISKDCLYHLNIALGGSSDEGRPLLLGAWIDLDSRVGEEYLYKVDVAL